MRFAWLILPILISFNLSAQGLLFVKGSYQGNNLYVQNPQTDIEGEYCMDSIYLNGRLVLSDLHLNAFEIKLDTLFASSEDTVELKIYHKGDCKPKILNPHIHPRPDFEMDSISIDSTAKIYFRIGGSGYLNLQVEQYRWNKWVKIDEILIVHLPFDTLIDVSQKVHSGANKFRLAVVDMSKNHPSEAVLFEKDRPKEEYRYDREMQQITINQFTQYEVFDAYGNIVLKGEGKQIDVSGLKKGAYYLNFGNQNVKFMKKPSKR